MPTYEYQCSKGHQFEVEQSMSEPPLKRCRVCRSKARRLISASSFILKGGGWYSDGYGSSKSGAKNGGGEGKSDGKSDSKSETSTTTPSKSEAKSDAKSDSKPAAKSDSKPSGGSAASAGP